MIDVHVVGGGRESRFLALLGMTTLLVKKLEAEIFL
jgi:hypothetical protein